MNHLDEKQLVCIMNGAVNRRIERYQILARYVKDGVSISRSDFYRLHDAIPDRDGDVYHEGEDRNLYTMVKQILLNRGAWY